MSKGELSCLIYCRETNCSNRRASIFSLGIAQSEENGGVAFPKNWAVTRYRGSGFEGFQARAGGNDAGEDRRIAWVRLGFPV
jgi:hypothetical protein